MPHYGKAIYHLYPAAVYRVDYEVSDEGDGRGPQITFWNEATLGPQPTLAQFEAAVLAFDAAQTQAATDAAALRTLIRSTAQSAVGVAYASLTAGQIKALLWVLLHKEGAVNADLTIKPLAQWARD